MRTVQIDRDGRLWMGSRGGAIARYDARSGQIDRFPHAGKSGVRVSSRIATARYGPARTPGLERFDPQARAFVSQALPLTAIDGRARRDCRIARARYGSAPSPAS